MPITSPHNEALKEIRKLAGRRWREKLGEFVAEGEDLVEAAAAAGWHPSAIYVAAGSGLNGVEVAPHVLATVSQLGSSTRALGVYPQRWAQPAGPHCVALWGVGDPGNVGTVIRSADGFGAAGVIIVGHGADPYDPKAVRASTGSLFAVPVVRVPAPGTVLDWLPAPVRVVGTDETGQLDVADHDLTGPTLLVVGNETTGMSAAWRDACDVVVRIPIGGAASSLNAATAASVVLYEAARQRSSPPPRPGADRDASHM
jgi:tRNA G18 (ribose-2'-O)-methylase SpoU